MTDEVTQDEVEETEQAEGAVDQSTADDTSTDDASLGDAGKQALDRMKAKVKAANARAIAAERERDEAKGLSEQERIQREADTQALAKANARIVRAEIRAASKGVLADPADAFKFVDTDKFEVDDDGNVDEQAIAQAIADLVKRKPYLAAAQGPQQRFQGSADQGARKVDQKSEEQQLTEALGEAEKRHDFAATIQIKTRLAALRRQATA